MSSFLKFGMTHVIGVRSEALARNGAKRPREKGRSAGRQGKAHRNSVTE